MVDPRLKNSGLTGRRLAKLTGQNEGTVSRKIRRNQNLHLGAREAGVMACFTVMDNEQKDQVDDKFDEIMEEFDKE